MLLMWRFLFFFISISLPSDLAYHICFAFLVMIFFFLVELGLIDCSQSSYGKEQGICLCYNGER